MDFKVVGKIRNQKTFAVGSGIREIKRLRKVYGPGKWRKRKGLAVIRLLNGMILEVELHWYEADGYGKREMKIKRIME